MDLKKQTGKAGILAGLLFAFAGAGMAQSQQQPPQQQAPPAAQQDKGKVQDLQLDNAPPPAANPEEDAAFKSFSDAANTDPKKKIELGEAFLQKYPQSRYRPPVYATLTMAYLQTGDVQKMESTGEKELELNPNDGQTLAILGQTIPRAFNPNAPDAAKQLDKAEEYSKRAIEVIPAMQKPPAVSDEAFSSAKNQALAMAHSGLGLVDVRKGKFNEAIPELESSVKLDSQPDPVNYYLLGVANKGASHYSDAEAAFNKCAAIASSMQPTCKAQADEAKKLGATQLSAPK
jgi:tetratricopeptide (TPR) repeat protein